MKNTFIYALCEPGTRTVRYIGKTINPKQRLRDHLKSSIKAKNHLGYWLSLLVRRGETPEMILLREVLGNGAEAEMRYIRLARGCRMNLVNATEGGEGAAGCLVTLETRAKMSASHSGEKNPMFGKRGPASPNFGSVRSPETCKKISSASLGVPKSPEHRASLKGRVFSPEHCENISKSKLGRKLPARPPRSPEHRAAHSASLRAGNARRKQRDQEIEWALAPYTLE